ncbi:MAG: peptide-methionine (S)-S-oxide reductase MsrA [Nitrospiria bacterium]
MKDVLRFTLAMVMALVGSVHAGTPTEPAVSVGPERPETAIFAGGCFWCMEPPFDALPGVHSTTSGYTGGTVPNPTYETVSEGKTGHVEAVQVVYDPTRVSYAQLLDVFWRNVDPLSADGQFCDRGPTYRSVIFYLNDEQRRGAEESKRALEASRRFPQPIVTQISAATAFYPAEAYHQDYARTHRFQYTFYRASCGRDARLRALWGDARDSVRSKP